MKAKAGPSATITQPCNEKWVLAGDWSVHGLGAIEAQLGALGETTNGPAQLDCSAISALDTAGAWLLQTLLLQLRAANATATIDGLQPAFAKRLEVVASQLAELAQHPDADEKPPASRLQRIGRSAVRIWEEAFALLSFVGETAMVMLLCIRQPRRIRWRPILFNIREAGFNALPIVGLLSFLLGVVVAYQGAD